MLEPGKQVKVRSFKKSFFCETSVLQMKEETLTLAVPFKPVLKLEPGDEVDVEVFQWEKEPLAFRAGVLDVAKDQVTLQKISGLNCRGNRSSERIDVIFEAEYISLAEKRFGGAFKEGRVLNISQTGSLFAVKESLCLSEELLLLFEFAFSTITKENVVSTAIKGEVVREHIGEGERDKKEINSYGIYFKKPFDILSK